MSAADRALLRSAVGADNYPDLVAVCERLDALGCRLALSQEGINRLMTALAEELITQKLAVEIANDGALPDTREPEDST